MSDWNWSHKARGIRILGLEMGEEWGGGGARDAVRAHSFLELSSVSEISSSHDKSVRFKEGCSCLSTTFSNIRFIGNSKHHCMHMISDKCIQNLEIARPKVTFSQRDSMNQIKKYYIDFWNSIFKQCNNIISIFILSVSYRSTKFFLCQQHAKHIIPLLIMFLFICRRGNSAVLEVPFSDHLPFVTQAFFCCTIFISCSS